MSLLNFCQFDDDTAVVSVDTLNSAGGECSKLLTLPHLGAVIAGRGRYDMFFVLALRAMVCSTFAHAAEELERGFRGIQDALPEHDRALAESFGISVATMHERYYDSQSSERLNAVQQMLLVGPATESGKLAALYLDRQGPDLPVTVLRCPGLVVSPPDDELNGAAAQMLATNTGAYLLASLQLERCAEAKRPGYGGRLLVARLCRGDISVRDLGKLHRPDEKTQAQRAA